jgi:hypothetical protein
MKQTLTKEQVLSMFCKDMEHPSIQLALHRSFKRYAELRDELAAKYSAKTTIPAEEFLSAYALHSFNKMG